MIAARGHCTPRFWRRQRVRVGLRNSRAKGKRLERPPVDLDRCQTATLRTQGLAWTAIANSSGVGCQTSATNPTASSAR
jgi:hypothetical protein